MTDTPTPKALTTKVRAAILALLGTLIAIGLTRLGVEPTAAEDIAGEVVEVVDDLTAPEVEAVDESADGSGDDGEGSGNGD